MKMISLQPSRSLSEPISVRRPRWQKVAFPTLDGYEFYRADCILCLTAEGNYTRVHFCDGKELLVCKTLRDAESGIGSLPNFVRIHRSHTINIHYLQRYVRGKGGEVELEGGKRLSVSSSRKANFLSILEYFAGHEL